LLSPLRIVRAGHSGWTAGAELAFDHLVEPVDHTVARSAHARPPQPRIGNRNLFEFKRFQDRTPSPRGSEPPGPALALDDGSRRRR